MTQPDPDTAVPADEEAILAAWKSWLREGWLQEGHWRSIRNDRALRAELVYGAFCTAWAKAREAERQRIRDGSQLYRGEFANPGWYRVPAGLLEGTDD